MLDLLRNPPRGRSSHSLHVLLTPRCGGSDAEELQALADLLSRRSAPSNPAETHHFLERQFIEPFRLGLKGCLGLHARPVRLVVSIASQPEVGWNIHRALERQRHIGAN